MIKRLSFFLVCFFVLSCSGPMISEHTGGGQSAAGYGQSEEGIGGTGKLAQEGIGGTGQIAGEGMGGTGRTLQEGLGGTGIVGTITGFGSIWVNKAHVHFDSSTPVTINQRPVDASAFKLGYVVSLMSDKQRDGYQARSIDIVKEVVGPIRQVGEGYIQVLGQKVLLNKDTLVFSGDDEIVKLSDLRPEQWVSVSGYRNADGSILAKRIDRIPVQSHVELIGPIADRNGIKTIFNQPIQLDQLLVDAGSKARPNQSRRVLVVGRFVDGMIQVERVEDDSIQSVIEEASELVWEGFVQAWDDDFYLNGIEFDLGSEFEFQEGEMFILEGSFADQEFILEEAYEAEDFDYEDFEGHEAEHEEGYDDYEDYEDYEEEFEEYDEEYEEYEGYEAGFEEYEEYYDDFEEEF